MSEFIETLNQTSPSRVVWYSIVFIVGLAIVGGTLSNLFDRRK